MLFWLAVAALRLRAKLGVTPAMVDAFCVFSHCRGVEEITIDVETTDDMFVVKTTLLTETRAELHSKGRAEREGAAMEAAAVAALYALLKHSTNATL